MSTLIGRITNTLLAPLIGWGERLKDAEENQKRNNDALSAAIRCCLPAQVVSYNPDNQTIVAQPTIQEKIVNRLSGDVYWQTTAQLVDVPVCFQQGGGFCATMPIQPGDEVLIVFADLSIDGWWQNGGIQKWLSRRRHHLSDGFAIPGVRSLPNVIPNVATDATELRSLDGSLSVSLKQSGGNSLTVKSDGAQVVMQKQTEVGFPTIWDSITMTANSSTFKIGETIKTVVIGGVPTPVPMDTISLDSPRILINGTDF